jgi:DNA-binding PadR family transcriptional regulator
VLHSEWRTGAGRPRRYYQLNPLGEELYERLTKRWRDLNDAVARLQDGDRTR